MRQLSNIPVGCLLAAILVSPIRAEDRKEIVIGAAELATASQRADKPTPGKWWLKRDARDWGARDGTILLTGQPGAGATKTGEWVVPPAHLFVPYRVPALVVDPKVSGWYRVYVGLFQDTRDPWIRPQLFGWLSDEPYPEYLRVPQHTKARIAEVYWKPADLMGRKIRLEQPLAPMPHPGHGWLGGVTHLRLVPMSKAEVDAAKKEIELPPASQRLFGMLDYTNEVFWWGTIESEGDVRGIVYRHWRADFEE